MLEWMSASTRSVRRYLPIPALDVDDDWLFAYKLLAPAVVMMFIVHLIPVVWGFTVSFMDFDAAFVSHWWDAPFIGLENYAKIFDPSTTIGSKFWVSLRQTLIFGFGSVAGIYLLGLATALLLNMDFRGRLAARTVVLIPWIAPAVVTILTWKMMLSYETGILNPLLVAAGVIDEYKFWILSDNAIYSLLTVNIWRNFPWAAIMLYAGLQSIPQQLYEAAEIDGAGRWAKFRYITLPQLKPVTGVILLLMMLWSFINFTIPFVLLGQSHTGSGEVLMLFIYAFSFNTWNFGEGAAMSTVLFLVAMVLAYLYYTRLLEDDLQQGGVS